MSCKIEPTYLWSKCLGALQKAGPETSFTNAESAFYKFVLETDAEHWNDSKFNPALYQNVLDKLKKFEQSRKKANMLSERLKKLRPVKASIPKQFI